MNSLCVKVKLQNSQFKSSKLIFASSKANWSLKVKVKVTSFEIIRDLDKLEAKIPNGSKVVAFRRNYTKFLSFKANLTLKGQGQVPQFSNLSDVFK